MEINTKEVTSHSAEVSTYQTLAIEHIAGQYSLQIADENSFEEQFKVLASWIQYLIENDFNKLIAVLYRVDVSEEKIRASLSANEGRKSGEVIAELIIEREIQKMKFRELYKKQ